MYFCLVSKGVSVCIKKKDDTLPIEIKINPQLPFYLARVVTYVVNIICVSSYSFPM